MPTVYAVAVDHAQDHPHGHDDAHDYAHDHAHGHSHGGGHSHSHGGGHPDAEPTTHAKRATALPGLRGATLLGMANGLVPSPSALVLLLAAVAGGQPLYGLTLALSFGLGMAAVLMGMGLAIVHGRQRLSNRLRHLGRQWPGLGRLGAATPWLVALVITGGGLLLTGQALAVQL